ncbi:ABC transporter substrate-binding protein [Actinomycetota bacterium]
MRRFVVLAAIALVGVACTPDDAVTTTSTTATDVTTTTLAPTTTAAPDGFGGSLTIATGGPIGSLNPFAPDFGLSRLAGNAVWATVYDIEPGTWDRIPDVVTGLPSDLGAIEINDDGSMTVRYEVRTGAMWSDGVPISGDDLVFTAETMRDLAVSGVGGVDPIMSTVIAADGVEDLAFITFAEPNLAFEDALWIILPSHILGGVDIIASNGALWPSGGPFVIDQVEEQDGQIARIALTRNESYGRSDDQGRRLPYLDALTFVATVSGEGAQTASAAFVAREADVAKLEPDPLELEAAGAVISDGAMIAATPTPVIEQITFQFSDARDAVNPASSNDQLDYRRAVAHAIDRPSLLAETLVPWSPETPGLLVPLGGSAWDRYGFDPDLASSLVDWRADDTAFDEQVSAVLSTTGNGDYRIRIGDALDEAFSDVGIRYEPIYLDSVIFFGETLAQGTFDIGMWAWVNDGGFANTIALADLFDPASTADFADVGAWDDAAATERYSEIVAELRMTADPERFDILVTEAEALLAGELPVIPLFHRSDHVGWWPDAALGIVPNGSRSDVTWNVETWQRAGE